MRGTVAKRLRKQVYGNAAPTNKRYVKHNATGVIICDRFRHEFQIAKKKYMANDYDPDIKGKAKAKAMIKRNLKNFIAWEKRSKEKDNE